MCIYILEGRDLNGFGEEGEPGFEESIDAVSSESKRIRLREFSPSSNVSHNDVSCKRWRFGS